MASSQWVGLVEEGRRKRGKRRDVQEREREKRENKNLDFEFWVFKTRIYNIFDFSKKLSFFSCIFDF